MKGKKKVIWSLLMVLALSCLLVGCGSQEQKTPAQSAPAQSAAQETKGIVWGILTPAALSEDEILEQEKGPQESEYINANMKKASKPVFFNNLNSMTMALESKKIDLMAGIPKTVADYLVAAKQNLSPKADYLVMGYSMMLSDSKADLRGRISKAIDDMKADGSMAELNKKYCMGKSAVDNINTKVEFSEYPGAETVVVAVTGDLPPMDYVNADGTPAGYNVALLKNIADKLKVNIKVIQIDSGARATALASGKCDVVFWNISAVSKDDALPVLDAVVGEKDKLESLDKIKWDLSNNVAKKSQPPHTILTSPYRVDMMTIISRK